MTRLSWGDVGDRYYETGVDRGVLFVEDNDGVVWNGLISVIESPSGGESRPFYLDGVKYSNSISPEEYAATIHAFSSPQEFDEVDGTQAIYTGLFATNQRRKPFGLTYRTKIGNDTDGADLNYKIHLVYNALAEPSDHEYSTVTNSSEPMALTWALTTSPSTFTGFKPTAHLVMDSRMTSSELLSRIEDVLYGSDTTASRLLDPSELMSMFAEYAVFIVTITGINSYTAEGSAVELISPTIFAFDHDSVVNNGDGSFTILDINVPTDYITYDGGTPSTVGDTTLDGGTLSAVDVFVEGGTPSSIQTLILDGGAP